MLWSIPFRQNFAGHSAQGMNLYEAQWPGLCAPLPTLRRRPYGLQRTARGRCGSLPAEQVCEIWSIGYQSAGLDGVTIIQRLSAAAA